MLNWDDLKYFLAVCKSGSIRGAAKLLNVNHATVSRRINNFEASYGERLFERSAKGYVPTRAGDELAQDAQSLEEKLSGVKRKVVSKDQALCGDIRVTFPDLFAPLLLPMFAEFNRLYPNIEFEILDSTRAFNLANREADVAFRVCETPPEYLVGRKVAVLHRACYIQRSLAQHSEDPVWLADQNWLGWTDKLRRPIGKIAREYPKLPSKHKIANTLIQAEACKQGMGVSIMPCFFGDSQHELVRVPPYTSEGKHDFWILNHPDMNQNTKIRTFIDFMRVKIGEQKALIEGRQFDRPRSALVTAGKND